MTGAIVRTELLLHFRRPVPYVLMALFSANAALWCLLGPAASRGWAVNSDFYIARLFGGFCFMTMPYFVALLMGDPVIKDQRTGVDSLIFSTPVGRGQYVMGKFLGSFVVLVCCLGCFALTACLLQAFPGPARVILPVRVVPYLSQFFLLVVISCLPVAALCFTVGTLTRNVKLVYGLVTGCYLLYISSQMAMKHLPLPWRIALDPMLLNLNELHKGRTAESLDHLALDYSGGLIANRLLMLLVAVACLLVLYARFSMAERLEVAGGRRHVQPLTLAAPREPALPDVRTSTAGARTVIRQLIGATVVELRLLSAERSLIVFLSLAVLVSFARLAAYDSTAYAVGAAESVSLFLLAIAVFYTGETLHRDRELRVEPVLWSVPAPDVVFVLSKLAAMLMLSLLLIAVVFLTSITLQIVRGHGPVDVAASLMVGSVILLPNTLFLIAASAALSYVLRDKYLAYAVGLALTGGCLYLFNLGYNHPLYNPVLHGLWTPTDLTIRSGRLSLLLTHRVYCLALAALCLSIAHLCFERKAGAGRHKGWTLVAMGVAATVAAITGAMIVSG